MFRRKTKLTNNNDVLRGRDIFLGMICVMFFLDTVGPVASMGASAITWSLIITVVFFFPSGLIMAEMGSAYPAEGGMYAWVKMAYGQAWGARMSWLYWANNAIWLSSTTIFTVSVFCQIFIGRIDFFYQMIMAVALIWVIILYSFRPLKKTTVLTNLGAILKIVIAGAMAVMAVIFIIKGNHPANDISISSLKPTFNQSFLFFPALIYNYLGFEVMSSMGNKIKNPVRDVPKATIETAVLISVLYIVSVLAILIIVPAENMTIVNAIMDCFLFADLSHFGSLVVVYGIGTVFLCILFVQAATWIVAAGRLAAGAADDHELPAIFGKRHKTNDTPQGALLITGGVATVLSIAYGFLAGSAEDLFWTLFSFTNIIFLLPYVINFQAFIKLRRTVTPLEGAYKLPGGKGVALFFCRLEQWVLLFTIGIIILGPALSGSLMEAFTLLGGTVVVLVVGEGFIRRYRKRI
ncbi:MAG: APC family permease [Bacillota bacterium]|nr:APC family permease [Bacillota bacterium]